MRRRRPGFVRRFVEDLVVLEACASDPASAPRTGDWVIARMDGAGQVVRAGLRATGTLLALSVWIRTGRPYAALGSERRLALARRLASSRLPLVADYVRAVRSLAVSHVYEARFPT